MKRSRDNAAHLLQEAANKKRRVLAAKPSIAKRRAAVHAAKAAYNQGVDSFLVDNARFNDVLRREVASPEMKRWLDDAIEEMKAAYTARIKGSRALRLEERKLVKASAAIRAKYATYCTAFGEYKQACEEAGVAESHTPRPVLRCDRITMSTRSLMKDIYELSDVPIVHKIAHVV